MLPWTLNVYSTSDKVLPSHSNVAETPRGVFKAARISALVNVLEDEGVMPASDSHCILDISWELFCVVGVTCLESWKCLEDGYYLGEIIDDFFLGFVVCETTWFEG